jgi:hypothetical protein
MRCPHCRQNLDEDELLKKMNVAKVKAFTASLAGRKARGQLKARSPEQARAAANARWAKEKEAEQA